MKKKAESRAVVHGGRIARYALESEMDFLGAKIKICYLLALNRLMALHNKEREACDLQSN